jgi:uncharacterized membrane protein
MWSSVNFKSKIFLYRIYKFCVCKRGTREVKMAKSKRRLNKEVDEKPRKNFIGSWAFLLGVVLAVILGMLGNFNSIWIIILVVVGLLVGLLNITEKEVMPFLMSGTALIIASALGGSVFYNVQVLGNVLDALLVIFIPAVIIVAIKNVFNLAEN